VSANFSALATIEFEVFSIPVTIAFAYSVRLGALAVGVARDGAGAGAYCLV